MSTTTTVQSVFPPFGQLVRRGAGTLNSVVTPQPVVATPTTPAPPTVPGTGDVNIDVLFYDSVSTPAANATPIASVRNGHGYSPATLNASYSTGLYVVSRTGSDIAVTTTP